MRGDKSPLLLVDRVTRHFGTCKVVDAVTLEARPGEIVGVSGPRGAGKKRLLELIVGSNRVDDGRIIFDGQDVTALNARERRRLGMASPLQQPSLRHRLREALRPRTLQQRLASSLAASSPRDGGMRRELIEEMLSAVGLLHARHQPPGSLSAGQRQRIAVAELLIGRPKLIILDEPFKALDPITIADFRALLAYARERFAAAVLLTDRSGHAGTVCDRLYTLENGSIATADSSIKIFINYRRGDDPGFAQALFQQLAGRFDHRQLFMDVEGRINPGDDYDRVLREQVERCDVLLAVIGPRWLTASDEKGARRLENPGDWVRIEIVAALEAGKQVIPVLVGGAHMPREEHLPKPLQPLSRRQAVRISPESFRSDAQRLMRYLQAARAGSKIVEWAD
jgi:ABC-type lipopolysaccharide export system ATPase subunit